MNTERWQFVDLGFVGFGAFLNIQDQVWKCRVEDKISDTVLFAEHPLAISFGARARKLQTLFLRVSLEEIVRRNIGVYETRRGGSLALHAPGILGCYVIGKTAESVGRTTVHFLEDVAHEVFCSSGLLTTPAPRAMIGFDRAKYRGAWTARGKIASIGIHSAQGITRFGMNINVSADPNLLTLIHPCGIEEYPLTTLALEGIRISVSRIKDTVREVVKRKESPA